MKICAMSDIHGILVKIPKCDVLIYAGDISNSGETQWFTETFLGYLRHMKNKYNKCFIVFGNHDDRIALGNGYSDKIPENVEILFSSGSIYKGVKFFGSPYCKSAPDIIHSMLNADEMILHHFYHDIPEDTDVLITHQPAYGFGDTVENQSYHLGSDSLMDRINIVKPKYHIFGHIHTGKKYTEHNGTKFYNVSVVDGEYNIKYKPTLINI